MKKNKLDFITATGGKVDIDPATVGHTIITGGNAESLLSKLNATELAKLDKWAALQTDNPVNLMLWPGWADALHRHITEGKGRAKDA
ncbi:hypothetical protein LNT40_24910 [Klebsiella pneumoniae]|nr:hypothetical protein [Klebsiella pneumoniae]